MKRQPAQLEGRHPMKSAVSAGGYGKAMDGLRPTTTFPQPPWKAATHLSTATWKTLRVYHSFHRIYYYCYRILIMKRRTKTTLRVRPLRTLYKPGLYTCD